MVVRDVEKIRKFFAWVLLWYSLEAMLIFFIFIGNWVLSKNNVNAPINVFFIGSMGSLIWPGVILLFFITGASLTPIFLMIFGSIIVSSITSIMIEYKYNISYSVLFDLLRRIDDKIIREISAWLFVWYILEVMLIFFLLLLTGLFNSASSVNKASDLINVLVIGSILSIFWPVIIISMFFLVDASSNAFFLVIFVSTVTFLIVSLIIKYKFNFSYSRVLAFR